MTIKIDAIPTVTAAAGDKVVIYDASTGDVGAVAATDFVSSVSATDKVLGRSSSGAGAVEEIPCTSVGRQLLAATSMTAVGTLINGGTGIPKIADATSTKAVTFANSNLSAARSITVPDVAGAMILASDTTTTKRITVDNTALTANRSIVFHDVAGAVPLLSDTVATRRVSFANGSLTAARSLTLQDASGTIPLCSDTTATKNVTFNNAGLGAARTYVLPNIAGEIYVQPSSPSYWLKAYSDTRRPDQVLQERTMIAIAPNGASFTLSPSQVPVKIASMTASSAEWRYLSMECVRRLMASVGAMMSADYNDTVGDAWFSSGIDLITSSTYCSNPISNIITGSGLDQDNTVYTSLPTWGENTNFGNMLRCVVGTDGTDIYYFNVIILANATAGYNQTFQWDTGTGWNMGASSGVPAVRKATSLVASTANDYYVNNNKVPATESVIFLNATVSVPI